MLMTDWNRAFLQPFFKSTHTMNRPTFYKVNETASNFDLYVLTPGWRKNELEIAVEKDQLIIKGDLEEEATPRPWQQAFEHRFHLPNTVNREAIEANLSEGVLTISLP